MNNYKKKIVFKQFIGLMHEQVMSHQTYTVCILDLMYIMLWTDQQP